MNEENNDNEKEFSIDFDKDDLKRQTKDTVDQVKDAFKNTDIKSGADEAKGFFKNFISHPITTLDSVINEERNYFSTGIILIVCFMIAAAAEYLMDRLLSSYESKIYLKNIVLRVVSPVIYILAFSVATYLFSGKERKSIPTIISGFAMTFSPYILINIVDIIYSIVYKVISIGFIFNMFTRTLLFASFGLSFYFISEYIGDKEDLDKNYRKTIVIVFAAYVVICLLQRLGICGAI